MLINGLPVLVWHRPEPLVKLPVVSLICNGCGEIAPYNGEGVGVARINGDSKYGYHTYHYAFCG